jgi:hypothetical protein
MCVLDPAAESVGDLVVSRGGGVYWRSQILQPSECPQLIIVACR